MLLRLLVWTVATVGTAHGSAIAQPPSVLTPAHPACAGDRSLRDVAAALQPLDPAGRDALHAMAASSDGPTRRCGLRALAALRDATVPALVREALGAPAWHDDVYLVLRWAAFAAGGPDTTASAAFAPLLDVVTGMATRDAAGDDVWALLGEIDDGIARDRLVAALGQPSSEATVDAIVHALARQGEGRPREIVARAGHDTADGLATNPTYEQARRMSAAAFYLLVVADDSRPEGLDLLGKLAPADQADAGAWAVQTLCERAVRRPAERASLDTRRRALVEALNQRGIRWDGLARGAFSCPVAP